jgi:hypothetical protein
MRAFAKQEAANLYSHYLMRTSVIICSHNSRMDDLARVLPALKEQGILAPNGSFF